MQLEYKNTEEWGKESCYMLIKILIHQKALQINLVGTENITQNT